MKRLVCVAACTLWPLAIGAQNLERGVPIKLTLDPLSMISIGDREFVSVPMASLPIRATQSGLTGVTALRIESNEFGERKLTVRGLEVAVRLARPGRGFARQLADGAYLVEIEALFEVTAAGHARTVPVVLTSGPIEAWSADGSRKLSVAGEPVDTSRAVRLVGAAPTPLDGGKASGDPIYVVLSGVLDRAPSGE
jgi:hypothetical protein